MPRKREKGQPEGAAVTGKTGKLRVAQHDFGREMQPVKITVT
jgi:hypothetical protein